MSEVTKGQATWQSEVVAAIDFEGKHFVELQEARVFAVASEKDPLLTFYYVLYFTDQGAWACTCKDFRYRGVPEHSCKHIFLVKEGLDN